MGKEAWAGRIFRTGTLILQSPFEGIASRAKVKESKTYEALCRLHMPRTLRDTIDLDAVTEIIDLMAGHSLSADQADYLEAHAWPLKR